MKQLILLTGEKLSGKGTAAEYLQTKYTVPVLRFSQVLVDIAERIHQEPSRNNLVKLGTALRAEFGDDLLANVVSADVAKATANRLVIDGLRYETELTTMQQVASCTVVYITASLETRFHRTKSRAEKPDELSMTLEEFAQRETDATELGIQAIAKQADHTIHNDGTFEELYAQLDTIIANLP